MLQLRRRVGRLDPVVVDVALVAAVLVVGFLGLAVEEPGPLGSSPLRWTLDVALALPLLARRRTPELALLAVAAASLLQAALVPPGPGFNGFLALLIAAFSVGAHATLATGLAAVGGALMAMFGIGLTMPPLTPEGIVIPVVYIGAAWGLGRLAQARGDRADRLAAEAARLARERDERARLAVAEERTRIARELHDVVAHAVTTMVLQADAAEAELGPDDRGRQRLNSIGSSGRQALGELRRLLAVLRGPDEGAADPQPAPGLGDLPRLIDETRAAGVHVDAEFDADGVALPASLELSVYRIVQEALTNVLRHAAASKASVAVRRDADRLTVEVRDDGAGRPVATLDGSGHGLVGMRERVVMFGGSLVAKPLAEGGFIVRAELPISGERE